MSKERERGAEGFVCGVVGLDRFGLFIFFLFFYFSFFLRSPFFFLISRSASRKNFNLKAATMPALFSMKRSHFFHPFYYIIALFFFFTKRKKIFFDVFLFIYFHYYFHDLQPPAVALNGINAQRRRAIRKYILKKKNE